MSDDQQERFSPETLIANWIKTATEFWGSAASGMWSQGRSGEGSAEGSGDASEAWQSALGMWQAMFSALGEPGAAEGLLKGVSTAPEIAMKMANSAWSGYFYLYQQWLERMGKLTETAEAYSFDELKQDLFKSWMEVYEKDFRQFLQVPQLGLTRFYQERANKALDRFNIFQAAMADFLYTLYVPMEKSMKVMQQELKENAEKGELSENFKDYYQRWIKILEGHYMTLFQSPEFTSCLNNVLTSLEDFRQAREEVMIDMMGGLPIPTNKELDELYKEMYVVKKKVRELGRKVDELTS